MPDEIFTINLNAQAIIPEAFILLGIVGTLLVDLAGEKTASKWAPILCYLSLGSSLISLALQWSNPVNISFLGSFNRSYRHDNTLYTQFLFCSFDQH